MSRPLAQVLPVSRRAGLLYALVTTLFWGVWGAFAGMPAEHGFPETLIYVVWAITMVPPALYALALLLVGYGGLLPKYVR